MMHEWLDKEMGEELMPLLSGYPVSYINTIIDKLNECRTTDEFYEWYSIRLMYSPICSIIVHLVEKYKGALTHA